MIGMCGGGAPGLSGTGEWWGFDAEGCGNKLGNENFSIAELRSRYGAGSSDNATAADGFDR
jgi:hypothetical protein